MVSLCSAGIRESNSISVISSFMPSLSAIAAAMSASMPCTLPSSPTNSYGGKVALVPMRSVPPSAEVEVVESCASLLESAVLEPPQPVSSIEPASTMLSIAMENFFICVNSFRFDPCKTGISF